MTRPQGSLGACVEADGGHKRSHGIGKNAASRLLRPRVGWVRNKVRTCPRGLRKSGVKNEVDNSGDAASTWSMEASRPPRLKVEAS
jgi:hypothetical protein